MDAPQLTVFAVLAATLVLFMTGRWRHDVVALAALLVSVILGLVPADQAFIGFAHPAIITVACILILSSALQRTGVVDFLASRLLPTNAGPTLMIAALTTLAAVLSSFMNNVGALALLMPIALQTAQRQELAPGKLLMPLSFGTMLGGMTTLIGTPSNLIVSGFRKQSGVDGFSMFDFSPVGITVAVSGVAFIALIGWRLVPTRERAGVETFNTAAYLTEARVADDSKAAELSLREAEAELEETEAQIIGLIRNDIRLIAVHPATRLHAGDILLIEADPDALAGALERLGLAFEEERRSAEQAEDDASASPEEETQADTQEDARLAGQSGIADDTKPSAMQQEAVRDEISSVVANPANISENDGQIQSGIQAIEEDTRDNEASETNAPESLTPSDKTTESAGDNAKNKKSGKPPQLDESELVELVVLPGSGLSGRTPRNVQIRKRFGINLLAISRQGARIQSRVRGASLRQGDVLLMQGSADLIAEFAATTGCAPLANRELRVPDRRKMLSAGAIMVLSVALAAFNVFPAAIAFGLGVLLVMITRVLPLRNVYDSVDWTVIVLLAALLPVAQAMETTGAAGLIATFLLDTLAQGNAVFALVLVMLVTMTLSDVINNAATAAIMCPIAIGSAAQLEASADPFLMAVAVGASCAFLTPIGHQNNTLILGPGGFRFGDYWPLGLPLELLVAISGTVMVLVVWPL